MFALDTNTLIYFFKGFGRVSQSLLATAPVEIAIPAIVVYELEVGIAQSSHPAKRRAQLDSLLAVVTILPFERNTGRHAAEITSSLHKAGEVIGPIDTLIAATALANDAVLVTHNTKEFRRVHGLRLIDWF